MSFLICRIHINARGTHFILFHLQESNFCTISHDICVEDVTHIWLFVEINRGSEV